VKQKNLPLSKRDYHSLHWLLYIYLQQGRYAKAEALLTQMRQSLAEFPKDDPRNLMFGTFTLANMVATFVVETERWDTAEQWLGAPQERAEDSQSQTQTSGGAHPMQAAVGVAQAPVIFARGLAIAAQGAPEAHKSMAELQAMRAQQTGMQVPFIAQILKMTEIQEVEIAAMAAAAQGNEAITIMRQATALEEAMPPPPGPPLVIKPAHELFGEILLRAKRPKEAAEQFATSLRRHKNRTRSLLGAARAAAQSGDTQGAANFYAQFAHQWQQADAQLPELREAQDYLKQASAR
jgi:tetratricopeptide (TPR) repeat protein